MSNAGTFTKLGIWAGMESDQMFGQNLHGSVKKVRKRKIEKGQNYFCLEKIKLDKRSQRGVQSVDLH